MLPNDYLSHLEREIQGAVPCATSAGAQLANAPQDLAVPTVCIAPEKWQSSCTSSGAAELLGNGCSWISALASVLLRDVGPKRGQWLEPWAHSTCHFIHPFWARNTFKWNQESAVSSCNPRTSSEWFYPIG